MPEAVIELLKERRAHRIGLMGGTFDPVHRAHVEMARRAMEQCALDAVLFLVSGDPPHKSARAPAADRFAMLELALAKEPGLYPSRVELDRKGVIYTVDTLRILCKELPKAEFTYIVGADTFYDLSHGGWRNVEEIYGLTRFVVFDRPDAKPMELPGGRVRAEFAQMPLLNISSTAVRRRVAQGLPYEELVHPNVARYIEEHGLYRGEGIGLNEAQEMLKGMVKPSRFRHILGVVESAEELAARFGVEPRRARWAALLHDCAKGMSYEDSVLAAGRIEPPVDRVTLSQPALIHAPVGALLAREVFGVEDEAVLEAIRVHTTGKRGMTALDLLLYVAYTIEPGREFPGVEEIRAAAKEDLVRAAVLCMNSTIRFVIASDGILHPGTVDARNDLVIQLKQRKNL